MLNDISVMVTFLIFGAIVCLLFIAYSLDQDHDARCKNRKKSLKEEWEIFEMQ